MKGWVITFPDKKVKFLSIRSAKIHIVWKLRKMSHLISGFQKLAKLDRFGIFFNELLSTQNVNEARFARNFECDFFYDFKQRAQDSRGEEGW